MSFKPLRNSKGVNKPFRSPFAGASTSKADGGKSNPNTPKSDPCKTPLRASSKRLLFQHTPPAKRQRENEENEETKEEAAKVRSEEILVLGDLKALKERVRRKQELVDSIKTKLLYKEKNKAEDLEAAIEKWTKGCQSALTDFHKELQERCGRSVAMTEVLSYFNIQPSLVRFSIEDDEFY